MIKTIIKHVFLEKCISILFNGIKSNFIVPQKTVKQLSAEEILRASKSIGDATRSQPMNDDLILYKVKQWGNVRRIWKIDTMGGFKV